MSEQVRAFDDWIRGPFVAINTELENLYFALPDRLAFDRVGGPLRARLYDEGAPFVAALFREGNTDEGADQAFDVLGSVGFWLAAISRHRVFNEKNPVGARLDEAHALSMHIAASIGVAPRFVAAHQTTHNRARAGAIKRFTALEDEALFTTENARGMLCYKRAADALTRICPIGVAHPIAASLFEDAAAALDEVKAVNLRLAAKLDIERFFFCIRPYFNTYEIKGRTWRGANAGDIAAVNEVDLLLGLCRANDVDYASMLVDKMLFLTPEDQASLKDCMRRRNFMDQFLELVASARGEPWFKANLRAFLAACEAHGAATAAHQGLLVRRFVKEPWDRLPEKDREGKVASGREMEANLAALQKLLNLRRAAPIEGVGSRHADLARLKALVV